MHENFINAMIDQIEKEADVANRKTAIAEFNSVSDSKTPLIFLLSFCHFI